MKDKLFNTENSFGPGGFVFDARVSEVFDDMVNRSVPGYQTIQLLTADLANRLHGGHPIYDLGCSTGNTLIAIIKRSTNQKLKLVGIDNSPDMLEICEKKIQPFLKNHEVVLENTEISSLQKLSHGPAGVIILNLVLQFIRPIERKKILQNLCENLVPGGALILVEKTIQEHANFNDLFINYYHDYKKELGYSEMEIAKKREALENKLIPFQPSENIQMLKENGFSKVTTFFQWLNFQGYLAMKI